MPALAPSPKRIENIRASMLLQCFDDRFLVLSLDIHTRKFSKNELVPESVLEANRYNRKYLVSLFPCLGFTHPEGTFFSEDAAGVIRETRRHEGFHGLMLDLKISHYAPYVAATEEGAAYAIEHGNLFRLTSNQRSYIRLYSFSSRHSVLFLAALNSQLPPSVLESSTESLVRASIAVMGDPFAIALSEACSFVLYRECRAILLQFGLKKGTDILADAVHIEYMEGLNAARNFLHSQLPPWIVKKLTTVGGFDVRDMVLHDPMTIHARCIEANIDPKLS
ncbi:hypothetical protein HZC07_01135 [Candidatus Micrarchaeota archaeon]|nr:hypothetical protein [Candidatus Micrarchaeota archaeon]